MLSVMLRALLFCVLSSWRLLLIMFVSCRIVLFGCFDSCLSWLLLFEFGCYVVRLFACFTLLIGLVKGLC